MPIEARDRLTRPIDIATNFARRRSGILGILSDEPETPSPITTTPSYGPIGVAEAARGSGSVTRTNLHNSRGNSSRGRILRRSPLSIGRENMQRTSGGRLGRGNGSNSVLPSWYPRTPLRDITAVVRAIERRRARLREVHGQENETSDHGISNSSTPSQDISMFSPNMTAGVKFRQRRVGKVPKILLNVTNQANGDSEFLTPEKKLLNSIDTVEKEVMNELQKLKRTPSAKQEAREKRVRTLMSMR